MPTTQINLNALIGELTDRLGILVHEVQLLDDRKTVLEHKLRFAHEKYQRLADKYPDVDQETTYILSKLWLPPALNGDQIQSIPLIHLGRTPVPEIKSTLRDVILAVERLEIFTFSNNPNVNNVRMNSEQSVQPWQKTKYETFEEDFTVAGKLGPLYCPFSCLGPLPTPGTIPKIPHLTVNVDSRNMPKQKKELLNEPDPLCPSMIINATKSPYSATASAKCPIRYLDQHSPEEVAKYLETHKHEIPRSHEICVKRQQRNESHIRKLDAKYGNLVSMIQGLGEKHLPILSAKEEEPSLEQLSNERLVTWAQNVSADESGQVDEGHISLEKNEKESSFDRPLKDVRVGESPGRPWGISISNLQAPEPLNIDAQPALSSPVDSSGSAKKCPFGHMAKMSAEPMLSSDRPTRAQNSWEHPDSNKDAQKTPQAPRPVLEPPFFKMNEEENNDPRTHSPKISEAHPKFINYPQVPSSGHGPVPQMVFTGPVFIGYPIEQAVNLMRQFRG
ncbi:BgTH12-05701 [Blumeria graminis f. sp. triticale]|uniref:BgTH12-05701 n=1 Tax=Blumeria graminis f. sp. triticale TaxID=1689686 RepID=A0A9W4D4J3_BLUGR|nr:BgTH12-05701 [Blumeria graminis f. sp. triticale]